MTSLKIQNGKFVRGGVEVPLEIGNAEQIALLKNYQLRIDELQGDGMLLDVEVEAKYTAATQFQCICDKWIFIEDDDASGEDDEDGVNALKDLTKTCSSCKRAYKTYKEDGELIVKLSK